MITQRLWPDDKYDLDFYREFISIIKNNPRSCDEVWLCTLMGMPPLSRHVRYVEKLSEIARLLRSSGIKVSLQIAQTIGHGFACPTDDCEGEPKGASLAVTTDGKEDGGHCVKSKEFGEYFYNVCKLYCEKLKPDAVYFDDDLRLRMWDGAPRCTCDNCVRGFNEKYNLNYTAEQLRDKIRQDFSVRDKFLEYSYQGVSAFAELVAKGCIDGYPDVTIGLQHGGYSGYLNKYVFNAFVKAGAKRTGSRAGAGAYTDKTPFDLVRKSNELEFQLVSVPDYVAEKYPELESYPHTFYIKSPRGFVMESALYLAQGFNRLSFAAVCGNYEKQFFAPLCAALSENAEYFSQMICDNEKTVRTGVTPFIPRDYTHTTGDKWYLSAFSFDNCECPYFYFGLPVTFDRRGSCGFYLNQWFAPKLSESETQTLLHSSAIITGGALYELNKKIGCDKTGVSAFPVANGIYEEIIPEKGSYYSAGAGGDCYYLQGDVVALSYFRPHTQGGYQGVPNDKKIACCIATTCYGAKWLIVGYAPESSVPTLAKRNLILEGAKVVCGEISVRTDGADRLCFYPRKNAQGDVTSITVFNASLENACECNIYVKNAHAKSAFSICLGGAKTELEMNYENDGTNDGTNDGINVINNGINASGNGIKVKISAMPPFGVQTVFLR